ncbi:solute carrier family 25 member 51-like isoform X2 [Varroa jacobsoni]|uniref:solute carrier family 25 member 51-like isoform X2 n=1 Tax=Varroa jacobsoni TaxID=62625 RepID=UPI000BF3DA22|nr:solute carrier family 25 member 51-like isoform X2 [Varroa jacobsoni]XP_022694255.1 solute carrier family 25 member 51-like isoform X2 [Varroa jacobsoni]XP_022694256.1 solute carrier family 25 member 51-like isoform X2 [Varroa jacobsoni]XP_022694257.1 solute carrier family 25 member 51-like isoform X2 [Varroa jacobsoni]XP_022694258.1 solute carrier family 25 member 51-like isoform X2 [Varroa jacobsoni]
MTDVTTFQAQHSTECRLLPDDEGGEFLAGAMAALVNISVTFPINKIMFRQMVHGVRTPAALSQLKNEGLVTLYKGCLPPVIQKTISTSIMFGTYAAYQRYLSTHLPQLETRRQKILAAFLAGTTEAVLCPLERAQCLLQDVEYAQRFKNTAHVFSAMSAYGVREYYRGLSAVLLRNGPSTMVFFGLRDVVRETLPVEPPSRKGLKGLQPEQMLADFVSGALVGAFVSTLFYPINVVKIRMQSSTTFCRRWNTVHLTCRCYPHSSRPSSRGIEGYINYSMESTSTTQERYYPGESRMRHTNFLRINTSYITGAVLNARMNDDRIHLHASDIIAIGD